MTSRGGEGSWSGSMLIERNMKTWQYDINIEELGKNVDIGLYSTVWASHVGDDTRIGRFVEIQNGVLIGSSCKIGSYSFVCEGVVIGNDVFVGPRVTFINDKRVHWPEKEDWKPEQTLVEMGAKIGAGAIIYPVRIGVGALVGAGAVVLKDVKSYSLVAGNPAEVLYEDWRQEWE